MIYVSSAAIRTESLVKTVEELAKNGFTNIELTAGNKLTDNWLENLMELKDKYGLNYLCHNYFPVPDEPFVLNLASQNSQTYNLSLNLARKAYAISQQLGAKKYALHAGFRIDIPVSQIGQKIEAIELNPDDKAWARFTDGVSTLYKEFEEVDLYVENNVFSAPNAESYRNQNPFYVTDSKGWNRLKTAHSKARLLLDVAHLKVSCQTLNLNFEKELEQLALQTNYIHLSDNDGKTDSNKGFDTSCQWLRQLSELELNKNNIYTIEVYGALADIDKAYNSTEKLLQ